MKDSKQVRNQLVAKRNDSIQRSRFALTLNQNKAVSYILSKVKKDDTPDTLYEFDCLEFIGVMRLKKNSYNEIRKMLQDIADKSMYIRDENGRDILVRWLNVVHMEPGSGRIMLKIHEDMAPYVFNLLEQKEKGGEFFTSYKISDIALMKHKYSPRIYELLKSYASNKQRWKFEFGTGSEWDLLPKIAQPHPQTGEPIIPKNWNSWAAFERDVLRPAKEEINLFCPIKIDYKGSKIDFKGVKQRRTCVIEFIMLNKTNGEQQDTENVINKEYEDIDSDKQFQQISFEEFLKADEEARQREALIAENEELERRQEKSICPLFLSEFQSFSDKQVETLYSACLEHIEFGLFSFKKRNLNDRELWAMDYARPYYEKITATPEDTKTDFFRRFLDCLKKDYDNIAPKINEQYRRG